MSIPAQSRDPDLHRAIKAISSRGSIPAHLIEELLPRDPLSKPGPCRKVVKEEKDAVFSKGVFEIMPRKTVAQSDLVLSGWFIRAIKNVGNSDAQLKARFVVQGHRDWDKRMFSQDSATHFISP